MTKLTTVTRVEKSSQLLARITAFFYRLQLKSRSNTRIFGRGVGVQTYLEFFYALERRNSRILYVGVFYVQWKKQIVTMAYYFTLQRIYWIFGFSHISIIWTKNDLLYPANKLYFHPPPIIFSNFKITKNISLSQLYQLQWTSTSQLQCYIISAGIWNNKYTNFIFWTAAWRINVVKIITVKYATCVAAKRKASKKLG